MTDWNPTDDELREFAEHADEWAMASTVRDLARLVLREREKLAAYMTAFGRDMNQARAENLTLGARAEKAEAQRDTARSIAVALEQELAHTEAEQASHG